MELIKLNLSSKLIELNFEENILNELLSDFNSYFELQINDYIEQKLENFKD